MDNLKKLALQAVFNDELYLVDDDFWASFNHEGGVYDVNFYNQESDNKTSIITIYPCFPSGDNNYVTDIESPIIAIQLKDVK